LPLMISLIVEYGLGAWAKSRHLFNKDTMDWTDSLFGL
jgi:hypothetical protein